MSRPCDWCGESCDDEFCSEACVTSSREANAEPNHEDSEAMEQEERASFKRLQAAYVKYSNLGRNFERELAFLSARGAR